MPPDPAGIRPGASTLAEPDQVLTPVDDSSPDWYDRSSLPGDFMVMIAGQTQEDFLRRAPERQFCEFIDGIVYMPAAVFPKHQFDIQFWLCLIMMFDADHPIGVPLTGPAVLKLRDGCLLEPDLFVLPVGGEGQIQGLYCQLPALLVVEVLSSDRSHDLIRKLALYREANVAEIWFVDNRDQVIIAERLNHETSEYETTRTKSGPMISRVLPGFWFDVGWLWGTPRPNLRICLNQILAGPPRA